MTDDVPPLVPPAASDAAERSLVEDVTRLVTDGRTLLEAELAYQKSRAAVAGQGVKAVAGCAALALALVFVALMALTFGLVLALAEVLGAWVATGVVTLGLLAFGALSGVVALRRWKRTAAQLTEAADAAG